MTASADRGTPAGARRSPAPSARLRARRAVAAEISSEATALFLAKGFDQTTVGEVAEACGMSTRSVSRYFATKEDMVVGRLTEAGHHIAERLRERPQAETAWEAMRRALDDEVASFESDAATLMATATMLALTPALRGALARKHDEWEAELVPILAARLDATTTSSTTPPLGSEVTARLVVATTSTCLTIAVEEWRQTDMGRPVAELLDDALDTVRLHAPAPGGPGTDGAPSR